jgi:hypothetical protein
MWFTSRCRRKAEHNPARERRSVPRLESLEDRMVPSTLGPIIDLSDPDVFAAFGSNGADKESPIAVNPTNPNNMVEAWWGGLGKGIATAVTFDGGNNWQQVIVPGITQAAGGSYAAAFDPWLAFTPRGELYLTTLPGPYSARINDAVLVSKSLDGGLHWGNPTTLDPLLEDDKSSITADPTDSRFVYAVWDQQHEQASKNFTMIGFARTTDDGATWEPARTIFDAGSNNRVADPVIAVLPDGTLTCVFVYLPFSNGNGSGQKNGILSVIRSTDSGQTWSAMVQGPTVPVFQITDPETGVPIVNNASNALVSPVAADRSNGNLYVTFEDNQLSGGQYSSIAFTMSSDGGLTWSAPIQVNQTPINIPPVDRNAFIPSIAVASDGSIGVSYYDLRFNGPSPGLLTDYWMVQYHPSVGKPATDPTAWGHEVRLTDTSFNLETALIPGGVYFLGDYEGLTTVGNDFLAAWAMPHDSDIDSVYFRHFFANGGAESARNSLALTALAADTSTGWTSPRRPAMLAQQQKPGFSQLRRFQGSTMETPIACTNLPGSAALMAARSTIAGLVPLPPASVTGPQATAYGWLTDIAPTSGGVFATLIHQGKGNKTGWEVGPEA